MFFHNLRPYATNTIGQNKVYAAALFLTIICLCFSVVVNGKWFYSKIFYPAEMFDVKKNNVILNTESIKDNDFPAIFGRSTKKRNEIVDSKLPLILQGVITGDSKAMSSAIIQSGSNVSRVYKVSDFIMEDVILMEIFADFVILSQDGVLQKLTYPKKASIFTELTDFSGMENKNGALNVGANLNSFE